MTHPTTAFLWMGAPEYESSDEDEVDDDTTLSMTWTLDEPLTIDVVEKKPPIITLTMMMPMMMTEQRRDLLQFYHALTERYTLSHELNKHDDPFFINNRIMNHVKNFTSTNYARENLLWEKSTNCSNNFTVTRNTVTRKLRFKPLTLALGYPMASTELSIIRANYFCYTYNELLYILYVTDLFSGNTSLILASYLETKYVTEFDEYSVRTTKYFCNRINNRCQAIYNFMNPDKIILSSKKHFFGQHVYDDPALLGYIRKFKKCYICGRRLQVWTSLGELAKMHDSAYEGTLGRAETRGVAVRIFTMIQEL